MSVNILAGSSLVLSVFSASCSRVITMASGYSPSVVDSMGEESKELFDGISSPETGGVAANRSATTTRCSVGRRLFSGNESPEDHVLRDVTNRSAPDPTPRQTASNDTQLLILHKVKKANAQLDMFSDRFDALESRLKSRTTSCLP